MLSVSREDYERRVAEGHAEVRRLPPMPLRKHSRLVPPTDTAVPVSVDIGPTGELLALWSTPAGSAAMSARTTGAGGAVFPDTRTAGTTPLHLTTQAAHSTIVTALADPGIAHPMVQQLPGGGSLLVGARCRWRTDSGAEHNAVVYDSDGAVVRTGTLGDGIEHVATTPSGRIWVGYFDEGVYGNYGWGSEGAPGPIGAPGLVAFDTDLRPEWRYPLLDHLDPISDCYALNVTGETVWACYYTGFPIVRVDDGRIASWDNRTHGAANLLVATDHTAALVGGYAGTRWRISAGRLGPSEFDVTARYRLTMPDGSEPPPGTRLSGRGPDLHSVVGDTWYRLDLDALF